MHLPCSPYEWISTESGIWNHLMDLVKCVKFLQSRLGHNSPFFIGNAGRH